MYPIHLLIHDPALADAVGEQLKIASFEYEIKTTPVDQPPQQPTILIIDEEACDAACIRQLQSIKNDACLILLLGAPVEIIDDRLVTEVFDKPVRLGHLLARLHFYSEIAPKLRSKPLAIGPYTLEAQHRNLQRENDTIRLTEKETSLLEYLAQSATPVGRDELLAGVWGYDARIDTHTLETHIYQLRRKIGSELIINEGGLYRLMK